MTLLDIITTTTNWAVLKWAHSSLTNGSFFAETSNSNSTLFTSPLISPSSLLLPTSLASSAASSAASSNPNQHGSDVLRDRIHIAHGVIASATIVVLFPSVAIVLRLVKSRHIVRLHYSMQLVNMGILMVAFSLGVWLSWLDGWVRFLPQKIPPAFFFNYYLFPFPAPINHPKKPKKKHYSPADNPSISLTKSSSYGTGPIK
jgi:hypothetical protein